MNHLWSPIVQSLSPYVPGEQPVGDRLIKLNTNENPFGPSPRVVEAICQHAQNGLAMYPPPESEELRASIADFHRVSVEQVFVGNGSDEVLAHCFLAFFKKALPILFPDITYSFYPVYCDLYEIPYRTIPLNSRFEIEIAAYDGPCDGVILANPNAPTGIALPASAIETLVAAHPRQVVVVDEAYVDFGGESVVPLVERYANLCVVQTVSKSRGLAGLRVGYAIAHSQLVTALSRVKNSFNSYPLDKLAQAGGAAAFADDAWFRQTVRQVVANRDQLVDGLLGMGFTVLPSSANFVFVTHREPASVLAQKLRDKQIIVRHFPMPRIDAFLRISVGTQEDIAALLTALQEILDQSKGRRTPVG